MGYQSRGLTPIEEVGIAQWFINTRYNQIQKEAEQRVKLAPGPIEMPRN